MTKEAILKEIEKVEHRMFYEKMADFMNWDAYYKLKRRKAELEEMLKGCSYDKS